MQEYCLVEKDIRETVIRAIEENIPNNSTNKIIAPDYDNND